MAHFMAKNILQNESSGFAVRAYLESKGISYEHCGEQWQALKQDIFEDIKDDIKLKRTAVKKIASAYKNINSNV